MSNRKSSLLEKVLLPILVAVIGGSILLFLEHRTDFFQDQEILTIPTIFSPLSAVGDSQETPNFNLVAQPPTPEVVGGVNNVDGDLMATEEASTPNRVFFDDFSDGIDTPLWSITGTSRIINDELTAVGNVIMSTGNNTWTDYVVELDIVPAFSGDCPLSGGVAPGSVSSVLFRVNPDKMLAADFHACVSTIPAWKFAYLWEMKQGKWEQIASYWGSINAERYNFTVASIGNKVTISIDEVETLSYITEIQSGWVSLYLVDGTKLSAVQIGPPE